MPPPATGLISTALTIWLTAKVFKRLPATDASIILVHSFAALADGAAAALEGAGFTDVATVDGGLGAWDPEALIVDDDEGLVRIHTCCGDKYERVCTCIWLDACTQGPGAPKAWRCF